MLGAVQCSTQHLAAWLVSLPSQPMNAHIGFRSVPPGPGGAGAEKMASAAAAPVFERVAGIRIIAESGRFKASSFPTSQEQVTGFNRKICPCDYLWGHRFRSPDHEFGIEIALSL